MAYEFVRRADGLVMCRLDPQEKAIIAQVAQEVGDLVRADLGLSSEPAAVREAAASEDPLTRLEAELAGVDREPSDSAVQRLFPASSSDAAQAAEFRRLGQRNLVDHALVALSRVHRDIDAVGPVQAEIVLDDEAAAAWLTALTDMRLVLADRLSVRGDDDIDTLRMLQQIEVDADLPADGGMRPQSEAEGATVAGPDLVLAVYDLLTWLQDSLVRVQIEGLDHPG
ncbi:DUF2017 family protein [Brachybacterium sp. AOP25-B2-12]|uniref:DUF2017 family protein n=1 Tax=Brachybacterium sp. AOP25-B2-12 TaxID=3457710 RepID=UPI00403368D1